jgi:hypothetical protein
MESAAVFQMPAAKISPGGSRASDKDAAKQLLESLYGCFLLPYPEPMSRHAPNGRQQCAAGGFVLAAQRELFPLNGHK